LGVLERRHRGVGVPWGPIERKEGGGARRAETENPHNCDKKKPLSRRVRHQKEERRLCSGSATAQRNRA